MSLLNTCTDSIPPTGGSVECPAQDPKGIWETESTEESGSVDVTIKRYTHDHFEGPPRQVVKSDFFEMCTIDLEVDDTEAMTIEHTATTPVIWGRESSDPSPWEPLPDQDPVGRTIIKGSWENEGEQKYDLFVVCE